MHENERYVLQKQTDELNQLKGERWFATAAYRVTIVTRFAGAIAVGASIPANLLDLIPLWEGVTIAGVGASFAASSINYIHHMRQYMENTRELIKDQEEKLKSLKS